MLMHSGEGADRGRLTCAHALIMCAGIGMTTLILWVLEKLLGVDVLLSASLLFKQYIDQMHPAQPSEQDVSQALRRAHTEASESASTEISA